jgi:hypothetical protein
MVQVLSCLSATGFVVTFLCTCALRLDAERRSVYIYNYYVMAATEWHPLVCVAGTVCRSYVGFACLITGSLWNAKLLEKLSKARAQWSQLRSPPASSKLGAIRA